MFYSPSKHSRCIWLSSFSDESNRVILTIVLAPPSLQWGKWLFFCQQFRRREIKCVHRNKMFLTQLQGGIRPPVVNPCIFVKINIHISKRNKHFFFLIPLTVVRGSHSADDVGREICRSKENKVLTLQKKSPSWLLYQNPPIIFSYNPRFVLLIRDRCFVCSLSALVTNHVIRRNVFRVPQSAVRKKCLYIWNMDILSYKNAWIYYKEALFTPWSHVRNILLRMTHFISRLLNCWQKHPLTPL